ncbi:DUF2058 domain-containing protein [Spongiibacter sp. KMU-158]|uniref:DUF2058 domain-containing protein n=1 Tax=Spongiibacter pelagi TaxID=2760804 RepID=A0A927GWY0_9GAMM|nr:DUF2058 domain-containing protein [Spongiibacter pelagi]MBD2859412.1 DUF2058 domain-containing protein [Spongiibacter pelagi]
MASLQEQLLKAGMADERKAKKIKQEQRKTAKQNKGKTVVDETKVAAQQALADKAERDREINRQRNAEAEKKAIQAQIIQLIELNRVSRDQGDIPYNFTDGKKIKKLHVTAKLQTQLVNGALAIVKLREQYELVPAVIAQKIQQRDESAILLLNVFSSNGVEEDDPYADYQIPDDLMW